MMFTCDTGRPSPSDHHRFEPPHDHITSQDHAHAYDVLMSLFQCILCPIVLFQICQSKEKIVFT